MATTIQVSEKTLQMLKRIKEKEGAHSYDEVVVGMALKEAKMPKSMFGSNPKLRPFKHEERAKFHE